MCYTMYVYEKCHLCSSFHEAVVQSRRCIHFKVSRPPFSREVGTLVTNSSLSSILHFAGLTQLRRTPVSATNRSIGKCECLTAFLPCIKLANVTAGTSDRALAVTMTSIDAPLVAAVPVEQAQSAIDLSGKRNRQACVGV